MSLINKFLAFNASTKKKIFRREVEKAISEGKQIKLPPVSSYSLQQRELVKNSFPFHIFVSDSKSMSIKKILEEAEESGKILNEAQSILNNSFNFFALGEKELGNKINWNFDYLSSFCFPDKPYWDINVQEFPKGVDVQTAWELG
ncbi:MAG: hypothetical protein COZ80_12465, partial [Ignavibacteria bacterium CG_4_8_14_3_um_filter_37_9]